MSNDCKKCNIEEYAAILIPTMCRYEHLKRCVDSLSKNELAEKTELYIGIDYPPEKKYLEGWKKVTEYVKNEVLGFKRVNLFAHESNLGAVGNAFFLLNKAKETHSRFIFTEDDNEFSLNYLEYMNYMLEIYKNDEDVIAVSGYNYPMEVDNNNDAAYYNNVYFAALGFGSWFEKYDRMVSNMTSKWLYDRYSNSAVMAKLRSCAPNQFCNFVKGFLGYTQLIEKDNIVWKMDLTYGLYMFFENKKMVYPIVSKVKNWGYDGSGINCDLASYDERKPVSHRNFNSNEQNLDTKIVFEFCGIVTDEENNLLMEKVNSYFSIPNSELWRSYIAYVISRLFGVKVIRKMLNK